jgi:hypothetical protein
MTAAERWPTEKRGFSTEIILPEGESCQRDVMRLLPAILAPGIAIDERPGMTLRHEYSPAGGSL